MVCTDVTGASVTVKYPNSEVFIGKELDKKIVYKIKIVQ
jgi:hypothetical protein